MCPPTGPGFEWNAWFKDQSSLVHKLCQRAARNRLGSMDELQMVPFEEEDQISFKFHVAYLMHFQRLFFIRNINLCLLFELLWFV